MAAAVPILERCERSLAPVRQALPKVEGKFLRAGEQKLYVKGVTYGTFRPGTDGEQYPSRERIAEDFRMMSANGINAVRVYTPPPKRLLDLAGDHGLRVMVGLPWEQHITFLSDRERPRRIREAVRSAVRDCAGHEAVLCYAIGNEIPSSIVRWHGARRVEQFLKTLYDVGKQEHPEALFTYVNFPTTGYLELPFLDLAAFNVYLESPEKLRSYLATIQTRSADKPVLMAEVGLDSLRNGEEEQARTLAWQVREVFAAGCAGIFLFSWTDEWHRGGHDVEDWRFGLVTGKRREKAALGAVRHTFQHVPFEPGLSWPSVSVVVCSYNGSRTIRETLGRLRELEYPAFEVIVVDDGSTDGTAAIAREFDVKLISIENGGLSNARNVGAQAATGEIVAYLDDDAYPDPHWLQYLGYAFATSTHAAIGGPNLSPLSDSFFAQCVSASPGNALQVLLTDEIAEHIPGCAFAVRKKCLEEVQGWDRTFRIAGDDVDLCWRLQERGWTIGFHHGALVWHHRRNGPRAYLRQQRGYGRAEALLERKWPAKYNGAGYVKWAGRLYGGLSAWLTTRHGRIYQGTWGMAPFQSLYEPSPNWLVAALSMPEWYCLTFLLGALSVGGFAWRPLMACAPLFLLGALGIAWQAAARGMRAGGGWKRRTVVSFLHVIQPVARLLGRLEYGLLPWGRGRLQIAGPRGVVDSVWSERWRDGWEWLSMVQAALRVRDARVGSDFEEWDLEVAGGMMGAARLRMAIEEHGTGKQMLRFRVLPRWSWGALSLAMGLFVAGAAGLLRGSPVGGFLLASTGLGLATWCLHDTWTAVGALRDAVRNLRKRV